MFEYLLYNTHFIEFISEIHFLESIKSVNKLFSKIHIFVNKLSIIDINYPIRSLVKKLVKYDKIYHLKILTNNIGYPSVNCILNRFSNKFSNIRNLTINYHISTNIGYKLLIKNINKLILDELHINIIKLYYSRPIILSETILKLNKNLQKFTFKCNDNKLKTCSTSLKLYWTEFPYKMNYINIDGVRIDYIFLNEIVKITNLNNIIISNCYFEDNIKHIKDVNYSKLYNLELINNNYSNPNTLNILTNQLNNTKTINTKMINLAISNYKYLNYSNLLLLSNYKLLRTLNLKYAVKIDDHILSLIKNCSQLTNLVLKYCFKITDKGIAYISNLKKLQKLNIGMLTRITGKSLINIKHLKYLNELNIESCISIKSNYFDLINEFKNLKKINVSGNYQFSKNNLKKMINSKLDIIYYNCIQL